MVTESYILPSYWASYLINGDHSSLTQEEVDEIDQWMATRDNPNFVDVGDSYITKYNDFHGLGLLCDVAEYTYLTK